MKFEQQLHASVAEWAEAELMLQSLFEVTERWPRRFKTTTEANIMSRRTHTNIYRDKHAEMHVCEWEIVITKSC